MAAQGSAVNATKQKRTTFGFSFSVASGAKARPDQGVTFNGTTIKHLKPGCAAQKKGLKVGWVVVAVDSLLVASEAELRAAIDARLAGGGGHFYRVHCRVDDGSAEALRASRKKDLEKAFKKKDALGAVDLRDLEAHRDDVVKDVALVLKFLRREALGELEVLLATATAAEIERFRELLAALERDDVPEIERVTNVVEDVARRDGYGQVCLHKARSGDAARALLARLPALARSKDDRGDEPLHRLERVAESEGAEFKRRTSVKKLPRLLAKTREVLDELGDCDADLARTASCWVLDWLACSVVCRDAAALRRVFVRLLAGDGGGKALRVKNTFRPQGGDVEYRDVKVWISGLGGYRAGASRPPLVVEVQLHLASFHEVLKHRHVIYEFVRGDYDWRPYDRSKRRGDGPGEAKPRVEAPTAAVADDDDVRLATADALVAQSADPASTDPALPPIKAGEQIRVVERTYAEGASAAGAMRLRFDAVKSPDRDWAPRAGWVSAVWQGGVWFAPQRPERVVAIELRDITSLEVDALVTSGYLLDGSLSGDEESPGLLGAVHRAAGPQLEQAMASHKARLEKDGTNDKDFTERRVVVTPGFDLKATVVLHTEVEYADGKRADECIAEQLARCLDVAAEAGHRSVAAPMLGTGLQGQDVADAARGCIAGLVRWYAGCPPHLHLPKGANQRAKPPPQVTICVFPDDRYFETVSALVDAADRANVKIQRLPARYVQAREREAIRRARETARSAEETRPLV